MKKKKANVIELADKYYRNPKRRENRKLKANKNIWKLIIKARNIAYFDMKCTFKTIYCIYWAQTDIKK